MDTLSFERLEPTLLPPGPLPCLQAEPDVTRDNAATVHPKLLTPALNPARCVVDVNSAAERNH